MKCAQCNAELRYQDGLYICDYCGSTFLRENLIPRESIQIQRNNDFVIQGTTLIAYRGSESDVCIPAGVATIGTNAFHDNLLLHSVTFSESVRVIEAGAFEGCTNLSSILSYTNIEVFGDFCFRCTNLKEITIGSNVTHLGKNCCSSIPSLKVVHYHPQKDLVLNHPFSNCPCLETVDTERNYFYPATKSSLAVPRSTDDKRPTYADAFATTPLIHNVRALLLDYYKRGVCPDCESKMKRRLFRQKCPHCHIVLKRPAK